MNTQEETQTIDTDTIDIIDNVEAENQDQTTEEEVAEGSNKLEEDYLKLKDDFVRLYADMENTKKRCQQEIEKNYKFAVTSFAKEMLSVADNLDRAIDAMKTCNQNCDELLKGVELTQSQLTKVFDKFNIKRLDRIGQKFDPNTESVIQELECEGKESGVIITELQAGYTINDRILREGMVIVAK